jgi:PAS domain S-box-containing protein
MEDNSIPRDKYGKSNQELNEEKYLRLFRDNPQPMWIYDLESLQFLEVNNAAINDYGYSKEEFLSMTLADIRPKEDVPALYEDVKKTWRKYNKAGVWRHLKKNGELILVSIISHEIDYEGRKARHVMISDITEEIKFREALQVSESNFRQLFENNITIMLIIDPETAYIVDANHAALALLRFYPGSEILKL